MARLLARPDPSGEPCPKCGAVALLTEKSYAASIDINTWRNCDLIVCAECRFGFFVGWIAKTPEGVWPNPIGYD